MPLPHPGGPNKRIIKKNLRHPGSSGATPIDVVDFKRRLDREPDCRLTSGAPIVKPLRRTQLHAGTVRCVKLYVRLRAIRAILVPLLAATQALAAGPSAAELFALGVRAEKSGNAAEAYALYARAAALEPARAEYWTRELAIRDKALAEAEKTESSAAAASLKTSESSITKPPFEFAVLTPQELAAAQEPAPSLEAGPGLRTFHLRGDPRTLFTEVAKAWGLEADFDSDYPSTAVRLRFDLTDADYREALHALELATGSFIVPRARNQILVAKESQQKRSELEPVVSVSIPLPEAASAQDFKEVTQAVQQAMALERVGFDSLNNTIVIRDRISKALPARDMLIELMVPRPEVAIEMQLMDISRNDAITYGVDLQSQFPLVPLTTWLNNKPTLGSAFTGLLRFGGGKSVLGLGVLSDAIVAQLSKASGRMLIQSMLRAVGGTAATLKVGDRYPLITSSYSLPTGSTEAGFAPAPVINYEDLGLTLKITPTVHDSTETTLDIDAEFKLLGGTSVDGMPIISNRTLKSQARLRFGEWAIVTGLLNSQEARNISGLAGLSRIPILGPLTSVRSKTDEGRQVLIMMRPLLLRPPASERRAPSFALGSDTRPITPF